MIGSNVVKGIYGGLAGGLAFGALMGMMSMLPVIGRIVGVPNAGVGFAVHMVISATIGAGFALVLGRRVSGGYSGLILGTLYGAVWWLLGPLTLMPLLLGEGFGVHWNVASVGEALPSLVGHLIYGAILGIVYSAVQTAPRSSQVPARGH